MGERFAVTAATGALGPVQVKLAALLGDEYKLQEGTRRGIESIKSELETVHHLLGKLWGREDLDVACKDWMAEARELSYDMEDGIDRFTLGSEHDEGGFIQRETTDDGPLKEFMERVKGVTKRCDEMQKIGDTIICNRSKLTTDPRALFLHKDASELVDMERKKEKLIKLLQEHEMVCIVGSAGMGKTTLADLVYQTIGDQFQCRAFVSVHPSPNMMEILGTILSQVTDVGTSAGGGTESAAEQNIVTDVSISLSEKSSGSDTEPAAEQNDFIKGISNFLSDKRYMVIIDDIWHWEEWEVIRKALPKNNLRCKLIMTTRVRSIAEKCETEQGAGVYTQYFGRADAARLSDMRLSKSVEGTNAKGLSTKIVDMCRWPPFYFCPLAVICLSTAWAESHHRVQGGDGEYDYDTWASHVLYDGFLITPSLKPLVQSLCLGFDDLPVQLRTCLLYCTIYPPECMFYKGCLVRRWIAEGFVSQVEVANSYLEELVSSNLLQHYSGKYTVHNIMRAFLVCKAKQDNFIAYYDGPGNSSHANQQIRRLYVTTGRYPDEDVLSHTRSLVVCGHQCQLGGAPFKAFKKLRVLQIHGSSSHLQNGHLVDICGLICLKYVDLVGCDQITELPREIGRLQNLETLRVAGTHISKLPTEIKNLERLETLDISWTRVGELPKEIRKLQHLRTLDMRGTKVRELPWEVQNSINVLVGDLPSVKMVKLAEAVSPDCVISSSGANCRGGLSIVFLHPFNARCEPLQVPLLKVDGRHMKVPLWVKQDLCNVCSLDISLCKLVEEDLEFLKTQMPNLQALELKFEVLPREPVAITGGGFSKLETFYVDCRLPRVTFKREAMRKLKHLEFKFYTGTAGQDYSMGIKNLDSLEKVIFRCSEYYTSDGPGIREMIDAVRREAAEHPNEITLCVNDMWPEVFGRGARWLCLADRAIIQKEIEEWKKGTEKKKREIEERAKRIRDQRHRLSTAAERRAEREKNNAVIQKEIQQEISRLEQLERLIRRAEISPCEELEQVISPRQELEQLPSAFNKSPVGVLPSCFIKKRVGTGDK